MGTAARVVAGIAFLSALALGGAAAAQEPAPPAPTLEGSPRDEVALTEVLEYLRTTYRKNIVLGKNAVGTQLATVWPPVTVTVKLDPYWSFEKALALVAEAAHCEVTREGNVWRVDQPARISIDVERADLRDVVLLIAGKSRANIIVGSDVPEGLLVSVRLRDIAWHHALSAVVKSVGMTLVREKSGDFWRCCEPAYAKRRLDAEAAAARAQLTLVAEAVVAAAERALAAAQRLAK